MRDSVDQETATKTVTGGDDDDDDESSVSGSIPLPLLLSMSILAALGVCYALALLFFNVVHRKKKIIKMTSPNVNVVILLGCCIAFVVIALLGFSSPTIPRHIIPTTLQACVFLLPLSFTMVYGSLFAKVVRIHMIFTNLSFNGKSTRDEHLLLGVAGLMLLDLAILLPWQLVDPITCRTSTWKKADAPSNVTYATEECFSELQVLWISLIYAYKVVLLSFGLYFTWQTRFVTLPSIRDARLIFGSVQSVALLGLTVFPILLVTSESAIIKYSVGSLAIWFSLMTTMTFLFIPKARLLWMEMRKEAAEDSNVARMQFSESMMKTKDAASKCIGSCFFRCCLRPSGDNEDRYAQEILATEIETLKRTIKEKDLTIRELTDRLYIGTEKFQQYLTTKTNRYDVWPQPVLRQHRCNEACQARVMTPHGDCLPSEARVMTSHGDCLPSEARVMTPHGGDRPPSDDCMSCMAEYRSRGTGCPASVVGDPRQRHQPTPLGRLDRRNELRDYRLSRYYTRDEEEDEDYDSRSYSDCSCSTSAATDLVEMQMRDAQLQRLKMSAADAPRELSAATLAMSYGGAECYAHQGVRTRPRRSSTAASRYYRPPYPPGSPRFQPGSVRPVDSSERTPSSAQDSAYDNSPSSTECAVELVNSHRGATRVQRTIEVRSYDDRITPQIVGVFSVHRPPKDEDCVATNVSHLDRRTIETDTSPATPLGLTSTNQQRHTTASATNSLGHAPPLPTHHRLQGAVSSNRPIRDLNPSSISVHDPMTSGSQAASSLQLVSSDYPIRNAETRAAPQLARETGQQVTNSSDGLSAIRTYGFTSVTQI